MSKTFTRLEAAIRIANGLHRTLTLDPHAAPRTMLAAALAASFALEGAAVDTRQLMVNIQSAPYGIVTFASLVIPGSEPEGEQVFAERRLECRVGPVLSIYAWVAPGGGVRALEALRPLGPSQLFTGAGFVGVDLDPAQYQERGAA